MKIQKTTLFKKPILYVISCIALLFVTAALLLWSDLSEGGETKPPMFPDVYFEGVYRIGDSDWHEVKKGKHIPATKGDVTLKGTFHMHFPEKGEYLGYMETGVPIAFFMNHIGITVYENGYEPYVMDTENPICGLSGCGQMWIGYKLRNSGEETVELLIHNPHRFGNDTAIDDFLSNLSVWPDADFDRKILSEGGPQRNSAMVLLVIAFAFLGTAIYSSVLRIKNSKYIWLIGFSVMFAGIYLLFSTDSISFWSNSVILNTTILCISMILFMFFISILAFASLKKVRRIGTVASLLLGCFDITILLIPVFFDVYIYDMMWIWGVAQVLTGITLSGLLIYETACFRKKDSILRVVPALLLISFVIDMGGVLSGSWSGSKVLSYVFLAALIFALVFVLRVVPHNIVAIARAKETELKQARLEAEKSAIEAQLKESRISTMLSQIQPHFIYNTLGNIERLCIKNPEQASELVRNFSLYLRGNFSELDSITPIPFSQEINHVEYYVNIEKVRFPDMTIDYRLECTDFVLPALTVQPLVENAIKHGLMRLESGGTVVIYSYETETHFCIEVTDNGVGFDTTLPIDKKEHVGLYNIRERLREIVDGTLTVDSVVGTGTTATIRIPKEDTAV